MRFFKNTIGVVFIIFMCVVYDVKTEDKWVWSKERETGVLQSSESAKISVAKPLLNDLLADLSSPQRYGVIDEPYRSGKHIASYDEQRGGRYAVSEQYDYLDRSPSSVGPFLNPTRRPFLPGPSYPPNRGPIDGLPLPSVVNGNIPPVSPTKGILTGPVPSWEKPILHKNSDPTSFDRCKCSFSFNCKSPGIQFGNCDQGKQYCCYNDFGHGGKSDSGFGASVDRYDRIPPVLVGPSGPGNNFPPVRPTLGYGSGGDFGLDSINGPFYNRGPGSFVPQDRPILPPYSGLHHDHRSS